MYLLVKCIHRRRVEVLGQVVSTVVERLVALVKEILLSAALTIIS